MKRELENYLLNTIEGSDNIDIQELSNIVSQEVAEINKDELIEKLIELGLLKSEDEACEEYLESGLLKMVTKKCNTALRTIIFNEILVTGLGQIYIIERLRKEYEGDRNE